MGIFSRFTKKDRQPNPAEARKSSGGKRGGADRENSGNTLDHLSNATTLQRDIGRATALKIDAIESEMTFEFVNTAPATLTGNTRPPNTVSPAPAPSPSTPAPTPAPAAAKPAASDEATLPLLEFPLEEAPVDAAPTAALDTPLAPPPDATKDLPNAPVLEEAAILFANGQTAVAGQILRDALQDEALGAAAPLAWFMLFDLYRLTADRERFDALSIAYAAKFETSPPAWIEVPALEPAKPAATRPAATPSVTFSGMLDAQITKQLARAQKLAESHPALRLEFTRVTGVDPVGCGLLLRVLKKLQKSGLELILVGAPELAGRIQAILEVGRRDETEAPWLLLLEILRLLNREQEFEERSIDYCITFEVSPPAFVAPQTRVTTASDDNAAPESEAGDAFLMPHVIEGDTKALTEALAAHAAGSHDPVVFDCSQLARVDFSAAGQILNSLAPLASRQVELHNVNHLVAVMLHALGLQHVARILPRKH
ncbi:MAG: STAS domain-containing protein [Burkholderiaceae bacterium]